jgi:hypothetical protein
VSAAYPSRRQCVLCHEWFTTEGFYDFVCSSTCTVEPPELTGVCPVCGVTFTTARADKRTCGQARCQKALQRKAPRGDRWQFAAKVVPLHHRDGQVLRLCACGCRKPLTGAAQQKFHSEACRKRSTRRRRPGSMSPLDEDLNPDTRGARESGHGEIRPNDSGASNKINRAKSDAGGAE